MEQNRLSLRDFGDEGRVEATLSRPKGARSPSPRKRLSAGSPRRDATRASPTSARTTPNRTSALLPVPPRSGPGVETRMEQTPERAARSGERGRAAAVAPCEVGVAGPEADPAQNGSEAPGRLWGASMEQVAFRSLMSARAPRGEAMAPVGRSLALPGHGGGVGMGRDKPVSCGAGALRTGRFPVSDPTRRPPVQCSCTSAPRSRSVRVGGRA